MWKGLCIIDSATDLTMVKGAAKESVFTFTNGFPADDGETNAYNIWDSLGD